VGFIDSRLPASEMVLWRQIFTQKYDFPPELFMSSKLRPPTYQGCGIETPYKRCTSGTLGWFQSVLLKKRSLGAINWSWQAV
jgi:hypothetical protein